MKKIYSILLAALAVCAVSCQEGPLEKPETEAGETMTFTASFGETKVALDGLQPKWEKGDAITIYSSNGHKRVFTTQDSGLTATFKADNVPADFNSPYYAVYGHLNDGATNLNNGYVHNIQIWKDQTVGDKYTAPMIASSSSRVLNFKNAAALLKFMVNADNVQSVTVATDAQISGEGSCGADAIYNRYLNDDPSFKQVTLRGEFVKGQTYHFVVAPTTIHSLKMYVNDQLYRSVENANIEILRNNVFDLQSVDGTTIYLQKSDWKWNNEKDHRRTNEICLYSKTNDAKYIFESAFNNSGIDGVNASKWVIFKPGIVGEEIPIHFQTKNVGHASNTMPVKIKHTMYFYADPADWYETWSFKSFEISKDKVTF